MRRLRLLWSTKDEVQHNVASSSPAIQTSSRPSIQPFFHVDHSGIRTDNNKSHAMPCHAPKPKHTQEKHAAGSVARLTTKKGA